jgi:hypothetical protein
MMPPRTPSLCIITGHVRLRYATASSVTNKRGSRAIARVLQSHKIMTYHIRIKVLKKILKCLTLEVGLLT